LGMRYDDGFIAYLNGEEIARRNAPANSTWSSSAAAGRADHEALVVEEIDVTPFADLLVIGRNVLAVHALDASPTDDRFLIGARLTARSFSSQSIRYLRVPTPGAPNDVESIAGYVADTSFSVDRGFYDAPFQVAI